MTRRLAILCATLFCVGALLAPAVWASVPKIILAEDFTATW